MYSYVCTTYVNANAGEEKEARVDMAPCFFVVVVVKYVATMVCCLVERSSESKREMYLVV